MNTETKFKIDWQPTLTGLTGTVKNAPIYIGIIPVDSEYIKYFIDYEGYIYEGRMFCDSVEFAKLSLEDTVVSILDNQE